MLELRHFSLIIGLCTVLLCNLAGADGFIKKEVYSFKDKSGNLVFTDRQPAKGKTYKTQTIEAANSTVNHDNNDQTEYQLQSNYSQDSYNKNYVNNTITQPQAVRIIIDDGSVSNKKYYKKKRSLKRCKFYKKKFVYYSDKMKGGYKSSEYKKLEANRKKYKNLLFNNCETKTFND